MEKEETKSRNNIKKMHLLLFSRRMCKENVAVHKKWLQGNNDAIFGWLIGALFAGGLAGSWVVSGFTAK